MRPFLSCLLPVISTVLSMDVHAANRYWVAPATAYWNNTANWSGSSGGVSGASVPGAGDAAYFDNGGLGDCTLDIGVNITNFNVNATYTGTINQGANTLSISKNAAFAGGIFAGGSANITVSGTLNLSGTSFTSTSAVLELNNTSNFSNGNFIHNNGTVRYNYTGTGSVSIAGTKAYIFYILEFVGKGRTYNLPATTITVINRLNLSGSLYYNLSVGAIDVNGDINVTNTATGCAGTATITINGTGTQNFNGSSSPGQGALPKLTINKTSGTLNLGNYPAVSGNFTYTAGTVDPGTSTLCFTNGSTATNNLTGSLALNNISFTALANQTFKLAAGTVLTINGDLTMDGTSNLTLNTGAMDIAGNIYLENTSNGGGGTTNINIVGTGNQTLDGTTLTAPQNLLPFITINKGSGTLTLMGTISVSKDWILTTGTVDASSFASTVVFGGSNLNISSAGMNFYNLAVRANTSTLTSNLSASNNITVSAGVLAAGFRTINLAGNWIGRGTAGFTESTSTVNLNGTGLQTITSAGGESFANLTINNSGAGVRLVNDATIATALTMTTGNIDLNGNNLTLGLSAATSGTLAYTTGTILGTGAFTRWFKSLTIANGAATGLFPVGTAMDYRPLYVAAPITKPTTGGTISVSYNDATTNSTTPYLDGATTIFSRKDLNWVAATGGSLAGGIYDVQVQGTGFGTIGNVADLRMTQVSSAIGTAGTNGGTTGNPQVNRTGLSLANLNNIFYIGSINISSTTLPITWVSFTASVMGRTVALNWSTTAEVTNDHFTVQRSRDGSYWESIQQVAAAGTGNSIQSYSAFDQAPVQGISYYRVLQTGRDGKQRYSLVRSIHLHKVSVDITIFPNPATEKILFAFPVAGKYEIAMLDINGQMMHTPVTVTGSQLAWDVSDMKAGTYFLRIQHGADSKTRKIMIKK